MNDTDLIKTIDFFKNYYTVNLTENQIIEVNNILKNYSYESFLTEIKKPLLLSTNYFTIAELYKIVQNNEQSKEFLKHLGINSWENFYANFTNGDDCNYEEY